MWVIIIVIVVVIAFRVVMQNAHKTTAATQPVGAVETYSYTGKSGRLSEQFSKMGMEQHINLMISNGWEVVNQTGLPGHIRLGRTLTGAALTGGLTLLLGGSRTADRVTITYRRVQNPRVASGRAISDPRDAVTKEFVEALERQKSHVSPTESKATVRYCCSCGSTLHEGSRFCSSCGAIVESQPAAPTGVDLRRTCVRPG